MRNKKKFLGMAAAAMLAVSPVVATGFVGISQTSVAHAATVLNMEQLNEPFYSDAKKKCDSRDFLVELDKKTPYLTAYNGETVRQLSKRRITDVTSNIGRVSSFDRLWVYPTMDDGNPDFGNALHDSDKLKAGQNYVALLSFKLKGSESDGTYLVSPIGTEYGVDEDGPSCNNVYDLGDPTGLFVPVHIENAPAKKSKASSTTKVKKYAVATRKTRIYTSTGKFSKHYTRKGKTYRLNRKKSIKHHGTCYKIYGKNQWIPAKYLR